MGDLADRIKNLAGGTDEVEEERILDDLSSYLENKGLDRDEVSNMILKVRYFADGHVDEIVDPSRNGGKETDKQMGNDASTPEATCSELVDAAASSSEAQREPAPCWQAPSLPSSSCEESPTDNMKAEPHFYWVSIGEKAGSRCLHVSNGCWRDPNVDVKKFQKYPTLPANTEYQRICRTCWRSAAMCEDGEDSASSGSSSTDEEV